MSRLGDIVTMPLPTEYGPEIYRNARVPQNVSMAFPGSGAGAAPGALQTPEQILAAAAANAGGPSGNPAGAVSPRPGVPLPPGWRWPMAHPSDRPGGAGGVPSSGFPGGARPGAGDAVAEPGMAILGEGGLMIPVPAVGTGPGAAAGGPWTRPPILPDWMLPPALQRSNPLLRQTPFRRNRWDNQILREACIWQWLAQNGGLKSCCRIPELGAPVYDGPPFQAMPSQGEEFKFMQGVALATFQAAQGVDVQILSFRVPEGYDGVLNRVVTNYSGNGFTEFSGDIVWRVLVGLRYAKGLGAITNTYGDYQTAFLVPGTSWPLVSGQTVTLMAQVAVGNPLVGGVISAGAFGYFYPHR